MISPDEINQAARIPVSRQIADAIRTRIVAGKLQTGDRLPSERDLADQLSRSRETIKTAYRMLATDGYAVIRHRQPVAVRRPPPVRLMDSQRYREVLEAIRRGTLDPEQGFCTDYGVAWSEYLVHMAAMIIQPATSVHMWLLDVPRNTPILVRHLVESARDVPVQIRRSVMPAKIAADTPVAWSSRQPWPGGTIGELMSLGFATTSVQEEIRARPATPDEAAALYLPGGMHVLEVTRVFLVDRGGVSTPMEASELVLPAAGNALRLTTHL